MEIQLADILIHIKETLVDAERQRVEDRLRGIDGVISVHKPDERPHLVTVEYRPDKTGSRTLLQSVRDQGLHAELVGL